MNGIKATSEAQNTCRRDVPQTPRLKESKVTETAQKALQTPGWNQTKFVSESGISSTFVWNNAAVIVTLTDGSIEWRILNTLKLNGTALKTNYMLGQPFQISDSIFYGGSDSQSNWSIVKLDPLGREITATSQGPNVYGIATDGTHLWGIGDSNILQFNPANLSLTNTHKTGLDTPVIIMYVNGYLVVGGNAGDITIFDSTSMSKTGTFSTNYGEPSLSLINPTTIAISNMWQSNGSVTLLDPSDMVTTIYSLGTIPYNGAYSMIEIGSTPDYITGTPKGIGLYTMDSEGDLVFQEMLLQGQNNEILDVSDLNIVSSTKFIAAGVSGLYVFTYDPEKRSLVMHHGISFGKITMPPLREKRRQQLELLKV